MYKKILYAITTYDAYAYVDLSITLHKQFGNDVIVIDDGSYSQKLHDVCIKHNIPFFGLCNNHIDKYGIGDVISTCQAIQYAYLHGYTHVVKQSRRWICLENPTPSLLKLIDETDGNTFSHLSNTWDFGFRTEFIAYKASAWINIIKKIYKDLKQNTNLGLIEHYIHVLAEQNQPNTELYQNYIKNHVYPKEKSGYIHWEWMGNDKKFTPKYILWHDNNQPIDYLIKSNELGLKYQLNDFQLVK